ncbi:YciI family protein [Kutzneria chonburiensis]|uniref:YciI family protein n=1 Tax=Kutzneria chonburiensis TaxID=1483604 RepID=A0ABV6N3H5_9PSEU|nr:YciI family protein [Kutzneria chonburiensis]
MKYLILAYGSQRDYDAMAGRPAPGAPTWTPQDFEAMGAYMEKLNNDLAESGELVETRGLTAPAHARRLQLKGSDLVVTDGPYAETQEVLAGYWVVECDSYDRATEIATRLFHVPGPAEIGPDVVVDIRPIGESRHEL